MPGHLMILNPTKRRRKAKKAGGKKRKRKMTAAQLKYFGKRKGKKRKAARRRETVIVATTNPRRGASMSKRRRRKSSKRRSFNRNPARRRFRRNPINVNYVTASIVPAAIGAAGAMAVDYAMTKLPLPASMQSGGMMAAVRVGLAFLVGGLVSAVDEKAGQAATSGALVVTAYQLAAQYAPQLTGADAGGYANGYGGGYGFNQQRGARMNRYVAMRGYMGRKRRLGAGPMRRRRLGAPPNVGVRSGNGIRPYAPVKLNAAPLRRRTMGYIGPAKTLARYVKR